MKMTGTSAVVAILALGLTPASAAAQDATSPTASEIVVEAPRVVPAPGPAEGASPRDPFTGAPIVTTTVKMTALYDDLDLRQPKDAQRLMERVERVAHDACATLDRLLPLSSDPDCVSRVTGNARREAHALIAAARQ